jgi:hypothetical protein
MTKAKKSQLPGAYEGLYMAFSDGTLLKFCYDEDGIWRFMVQFQGSLFTEKLVGSLESMRQTFAWE